MNWYFKTKEFKKREQRSCTTRVDKDFVNEYFEKYEADKERHKKKYNLSDKYMKY